MARKRLSAEQIVMKLRQIEVLQGHTCNNLSLRLVQNIGQVKRPAGQLSHLPYLAEKRAALDAWADYVLRTVNETPILRDAA